MIDPKVLQEILSLGRRSQSPMQVDRFVIARNGMTLFGVLKQAHREVHDRWESLKTTWIKLRGQQVALSDVHTKHGLVPEIQRLHLVTARMVEQSLLSEFEDMARLFLRCYAHAEWARERLIEQHGALSRELLDELDEQEWALQLKRTLAIEMRQVGYPSSTTIDLVSTMREPIRSQLFDVSDLGNRGPLWEWLKSYDYPQPPADRFALSVGELKKLVAGEVESQGLLLCEATEDAIP